MNKNKQLIIALPLELWSVINENAVRYNSENHILSYNNRYYVLSILEKYFYTDKKNTLRVKRHRINLNNLECKSISINISYKLYLQLDNYCKLNGGNITTFIRSALYDFFNYTSNKVVDDKLSLDFEGELRPIVERKNISMSDILKEGIINNNELNLVERDYDIKKDNYNAEEPFIIKSMNTTGVDVLENKHKTPSINNKALAFSHLIILMILNLILYTIYISFDFVDIRYLYVSSIISVLGYIYLSLLRITKK